MEIPARPDAVSINLERTAVLVVDMQNDFGTKGGMFHRAGVDISPIQSVIGPIERVLASARRAGLKIIYLKMGFHPDLSDLGAPDSTNRVRHLLFGAGETVCAPNGTESRILIRNTWNTDIVAGLEPRSDDIMSKDEVVKVLGRRNSKRQRSLSTIRRRTPRSFPLREKSPSAPPDPRILAPICGHDL